MVEPCDVLAVGAHPDDVELGCGGTLARLSAAGRRVGVVDLTAGELATRGSVEERRSEAAAAARALTVAWRWCLHLPDGHLDGDDDGQCRALVEVVRAATPRALLIHHRDDPHPDHGAAAALSLRAAFLAGVGRWAPEFGPPSRPALLLAFAGPRQQLEPDVVVDIGAVSSAKEAALAAHVSQFDPEWGNGGEAATHLASGHFLAAVEGRDRASGNLIGAELGEGLVFARPPALDDLAWLLARGQD